MQDAEREQRASPVERQIHLLVLAQRLVEGCAGAVMIALGRAQEPAAACADRSLPRTIDSSCAFLQPIEELGRRGEVADTHERFDGRL